MTTDELRNATARWKIVAVVAAAFFAGMLFNTWRMVRVPIDEYHVARMEIEEKLAEIEEILNE